MVSDEECDSAIALAKGQWPGIEVEREAFIEVAKRFEAEASQLHELFLAQACLTGQPGALRFFERDYFEAVRVAARQLKATDSECEELTQLTRVRLLVGDQPRLREYHGRGSLRGWLKAVTLRVGLNEIKQRTRGQQREQPVAEVPDFTLEHDPTLLVLRNRHRDDFDAALRTGWQQLTSQQRTILQMSVLDGQSIDRIGAVYGVHRTTAFRWLEQSKTELLEAARGALAARLALSPTELESLLRGIGSQLDVSIRTIMRPASTTSAT